MRIMTNHRSTLEKGDFLFALTGSAGYLLKSFDMIKLLRKHPAADGGYEKEKSYMKFGPK